MSKHNKEELDETMKEEIKNLSSAIAVSKGKVDRHLAKAMENNDDDFFLKAREEIDRIKEEISKMGEKKVYKSKVKSSFEKDSSYLKAFGDNWLSSIKNVKISIDDKGDTYYEIDLNT